MKHLSLSLSLLLVVSIQVVIAQQKVNYYPDSIRVELPDEHTLIVFEMRSIKKDHAFIKEFPTQFSELLANVKKCMPSNFSETGPYVIQIKMLSKTFEETRKPASDFTKKVFGDKTEMTISKPEKPQTRVLLKEDKIIELLPPGWEVSIVSDTYKISIYTESFQGLVSLSHADLTQVSSTLENDLGVRKIGQKSIYARMTFQQNKMEKSPIQYNSLSATIALSAIAGVGLLRDKLYPELSFKMWLSLKDHFYNQNVRTSLIYTNLFFSEKNAERYSTFVNSFLSLSVERNFNRTGGQPHWSGIGVGLLVRKSGDYFTGQTAKAFITHEIGSQVSIVPEFYLTDNFKKFVFGMTVKYSF